MRRGILLSTVFALMAGLAVAQSAAKKETITIAGTAVGFTASTLTTDDGVQASYCQGRLETAQVRYYLTGDTPTSALGTLLEVGDFITIPGITNLRQFKAIRTGTVSGSIQFQCFFSGR